MQLKDLKCQACQAGAPPVTEEETAAFKPQLPQWEIIEENNIKKLVRKFKFNDFEETMSFVNKIANLAQEQGHHPLMLIEYNRVTVWWWTHKIKGLHRNDFIMAAKSDNIAKLFF